MKTYKTVSSLKKHYPIGRIGNHCDLGTCKVIGYSTNRRNEAKLEIAIRCIDGLKTIAVDNCEVELKGRISRSEQSEMDAYFTE